MHPPSAPRQPTPRPRPSAAVWVLVALALLVVFGWRKRHLSPPDSMNAHPDKELHPVAPGPGHASAEAPRSRDASRLPRPPESEAAQQVAARVAAFVQSRSELAEAMARRYGFEVPAEIRRFFDLASGGTWEEVSAFYEDLADRRGKGDVDPNQHRLWPAVLETYGVLEAAQSWPAQALLDYGRAVLDPLPPGTVFFGGTDAGRFIPTLLNATDDNPRIVLTQNALADLTYLDYAEFVYGDRLTALTHEDSTRAFASYVEDARKRLQHDQEFPGEPRQVRPGEDITVDQDGRVSVGGMLAVMAINERLLEQLMAKNPGVPFAMEESFPLQSIYGTSSPRSAVIELRGAEGGGDPMTPARAQESVAYWTAAMDSLRGNPGVRDTPAAGESWAKLLIGQAGLLQEQKFSAEAETLFRMATELAPGHPESVVRHLQLLSGQGRWPEAEQLVQSALAAAPENPQFQELLAVIRAQSLAPSPP